MSDYLTASLTVRSLGGCSAPQGGDGRARCASCVTTAHHRDVERLKATTNAILIAIEGRDFAEDGDVIPCLVREVFPNEVVRNSATVGAGAGADPGGSCGGEGQYGKQIVFL